MHIPLPECAGQPHPGLRGSGQGGSSPTWSEEISLVSSDNTALCLPWGLCLKLCGKFLEQSSSQMAQVLGNLSPWGRVGMSLHKELCTVEAWSWDVQWDGSSLGVQEIFEWLSHFSLGASTCELCSPPVFLEENPLCCWKSRSRNTLGSSQ